MSKARKNQITVLIAIQDWTDTHRRGFEISEIQEHTHGVSDRTVRRIVKELVDEGLIEKRNTGLYYPLLSLQSTWFDTV
jgi:DNA-binding IclR family transcriptional regulator